MPNKDTIKSALKSPAQLSLQFIAEEPRTVIFSHDVYQFTGKYYELVSDFDLAKKIFTFFDNHKCLEHWRASKVEEMIKAVKYNPETKSVKFDDYDDSINFNNGILNLDTMKFQPHTPDFLFSYCINIDYDPTNTSAPIFTKFLCDLFTDGKGVVDKETVLNLIQIGGYLLYPKNKMEKLFMFLGDGANGKSVLIESYKMFFDTKFLSSLSLSALSEENNFARANLINSRLNIATEQKGGDIDPEEIKKIVSGEDITINIKYKEAVNFKSNCKIVVASNSAPFLNDSSHGSMRRLYLVDFKNRFVNQGDYDKTQNPHKKRIFLAANKDKLIADIKSEASAILNLYIEGLQQLRKNNWVLKETANTEMIKNEYTESSDTVGMWLDNNYRLIEESDGEVINMFAKHPTFDEIYDEFRSWYEYNLPGKKFNYSKILIGKKIRDKYRIDTKRVWKDDPDSKIKKYTCAYPLMRIYDGEERSDDVPADISNKQNQINWQESM